MNSKLKKIIVFLFKLAVSLGLVWWLVLKVDWPSVWNYWQQIAYWQIALYIGTLLLGMIISALKWQTLAEFKEFKLPLVRYFHLYLAGTFINNFMPSFIGGDTYRAYQIGKPTKKYSAAAATVVMDRVTGLLGAMILSVVFGVLNWKNVSNFHTLQFILLAVVLILVGVVMVAFLSRLAWWKKNAKFVPAKIQTVIKDFAQYEGSRALYVSLLYAILFSLVGLAGVNYVLFYAVGIKIGILNYLTVIFLVSIVSSIPVSINNIGIKEWAYLTFFGFFGAPASAVVAVALLSRVLQMVVSFAALPIYLKNKK